MSLTKYTADAIQANHQDITYLRSVIYELERKYLLLLDHLQIQGVSEGKSYRLEAKQQLEQLQIPKEAANG